ncbi:hypothetical protein [Amphritea pacifica]|uniref:hypothetical protein n=1 Tax=Amphritea pacifica TaxID=2811233 RepID=UPI0019625DAA|nr:hypothetical protein [Amphritea pacifica]MBN1006212.1 hypothetical protein [Amphritea pacifica]
MNVAGRLLATVIPFLLICLSGSMLTGCDKEPSVETPGVSVGPIDPSNQREFVRQMVGTYLLLSNELQNQYQQFKATDDADGFVLYRNNHWTPEYIANKSAYEKRFYEQKAYIYRHQLDGLFDLFFGLHKLSVHLKHSLLEKDWKLEQQVLQKLTADQAAVNRYLLVAP